ncbi:carbohydrate ABC transporter permease [Microtetraspora malaysiensis]|uniref:carbohydrate ABC transporter permease n=1 Tax=Microtetraspora malaysiensis TaxID=161358 RepID=UPI000A70E0A5|nr:hypothetical protein [Microtetraspora malaysiensis]
MSRLKGAPSPPGEARQVSTFVLPALVLIGVFLVFPALWTIYLGLTDYRLTGLEAAEPQVVGLDNYTSALGDERFRGSLWLTVQFVLGSAVIGQAGLGFAIAWVLRDRRGPVKRVVFALAYLRLLRSRHAEAAP